MDAYIVINGPANFPLYICTQLTLRSQVLPEIK